MDVNALTCGPSASSCTDLIVHGPGRGESRARSAVEHGYFDEAHMVNDACGLFGASQHALLRRPFSSKLGVAGCRTLLTSSRREEGKRWT